LDSTTFLIIINWHFGLIFKLLLLSEATSVFSAAHADILITMSPSSVVLLDPINLKHILNYKYEELEVYKMSSLLKKSNSRTMKHSEQQFDRT